MTISGYGVSVWGDEMFENWLWWWWHNFCEHTEDNWTAYFKWVNCMVCELHLNKAIKEIKEGKRQKERRRREGTNSMFYKITSSYFYYSLRKKVKVLVAQSCPTLYDPMECSLPGFSVHGIFQVRILEQVAISFCRVSSQLRDLTQVSHIVGRLLTVEPPGKLYN